MAESKVVRFAVLYDRAFFLVWLITLSIVLMIFGLEKLNISAEKTIRELAIVNISSPPMSNYGENSRFVEISKQGTIGDGDFPIFVLELQHPESFSRILVNGKIRRRVMHNGNIYRAFSDFFGSDVAFGTLKYVDQNGIRQKLAVQFQYPDYDQSEFKLKFSFRLMVSDEIPASYSIPFTDPEIILKGNITDVRIEIPFEATK